VPSLPLDSAQSLFCWPSPVKRPSRVAGTPKISSLAREGAVAARDYYSYLHLPMIGGMVLFALGLKKTIEQVGRALRRAVRLLSHPRRPPRMPRPFRPPGGRETARLELWA
jgi:hypothetical protein